ncbi:hypothetical protein GPECTOR_40g535 [Gonium pectorale]|uniref:Uncharacterized protein n=1 Tax=Gonium pectorale TaxID=33097 RepID=A0A150GAD6_GONPE|nr:hypothetical protein GPECTOR_40g535 [Gonium pectorale]|eukprot:KXZ46801.1 hypothetical protein GPECTOR_40g535 [Gonium pectorale]
MAGLESLPADEADAAVLAAALQLQRLLADPRIVQAADPWVTHEDEEAEADGSPSSPWSGLSRTGTVIQRLSSEDGDVRGEMGYNWGEVSISSSSGSSVDFVELAAAEAEAARRRREAAEAADAAAQRRRPPAKPLTFVCSLRDHQNAAVLRAIADVACRTASASVAAAVRRHGDGAAAGTEAAADGGGGGGWARGLSIEAVEPGAIVSGILAQVAADPRLASGLEDLLDESGCELYLKRPDRYGLPPLERLSWEQVCEVVHATGDAALGYQHRGHLVLAPPAASPLVLVAGDKLVVLSESFL